MKKINSKKLELSQSTIRLLSSQQLSNAGGGITGTCTTGCSDKTACHCFPRTMYPTE
jgi:hypothetical protein